MAASGDPVTTLRTELSALERAYTLGHHGRWSARRRSDLFDACLQELVRRAGSPEGIAVAALGGYGRRLQLPRSDLDVLLLHEEASPEVVRALAEAISYPLWDAGFIVGQVVRTPAECLVAARDRLDSLTAMLDSRSVAGDPRLLARAMAPVLDLAREDPERFAARVRAEADRRSERYGSTAHLLEPDLKEGSGGLRDIASLRWLQAAAGTSLEDAGLLRSSERGVVDAAEEFLVRARSAVHLVTAREQGRDTGREATRSGTRSDRLVMELQPEVAEGMGFTDQPRLTAADGLMRTLFEHARNVEHIRSAVLDRMLADRRDGAVPSLAGPAEILEAVAGVAEGSGGRGVPGPRLLDAIETADVPDPVAWTPEVRDAFLRLLRAGAPGTDMLDALDRLGLLSRYLTSWGAVRCRPQRDPYHRYTVDMHLLTTVGGMASMLRGDSDLEDGPARTDDPLQREAVHTVDRPDGALLGALLHDIGKVGAGEHVPTGVAISQDQLDVMSLVPADRDLAAFMVAEHLLLPDTATRRDLTDENLILDVAARVGTPERLAALYLLAKADARATGPLAWTTWRQALIRELVSKVQRAFERGAMGEELAATLAERVDRLRALLTAEPAAEVDRFVLRMPRGYFLSVEPVQAARHYAAITPPLGTHEVRAAAVEGTRPGTYEVLVVATDRPGLLSLIAGALSLGGISILSAQVFTTEDGTAVDLFEVEGAFEPEIAEGRWRDFRGTLRRALDGSLSLEGRVEEQRRHYPLRGVAAPVTVQVDNEASDFSTVIEVGASDRIGLLHDITRTFADLQLDVHLAKVTTFDRRVVDAFYVRDAFGRKLVDPGQLDEVDAALRERLT